MATRKTLTIFLATITGLVLLMTSSAMAAETPKFGGTLRVATEAEPPLLDPHLTTTAIVLRLSMHWMEAPFNQGAKYEIIPELVESYKTNADYSVWDIKFRQGVLFHNGREMTAEDVVASMNRWGKGISYGKVMYRNVKPVEALDRYTVRITLNKSSAILSAYMTQRTRCFIYPKEVIEEVGLKPVKQVIGTGPYQFVEHKPDRYVKVKRFEKYTARTDPRNGYGGKKVAYYDEILFIPVPEPVQRVNMLQGGEVDVAYAMQTDAYQRLEADPNIDPILTKSWYIIGVFNKKKGPFVNEKLRQAVQTALDMDPIMMNVAGSKQFYDLNPNLHYKGTVWETNAGAEYYNQANPEKAKMLMKEAGYKGEKIRWLVTKRYHYMYNSAVVAAQQLRDVGFNIDLQVMDWATVKQRRAKPDEYEIFTTGTGIQTDPSGQSMLTCGWPGWSCFKELDDLMLKFITQVNFKQRYATWEKIQRFFYEHAVNIKFGDFYTLFGKRKYVKGYISMAWPYWWNSWLDK
ncbi:MAG: ABC transporter substrate-binding protein [Deltaproteobacteria bacterium]|nr:ABC transporter substrate-binding protein [Deltaproteobacteria bacterium]